MTLRPVLALLLTALVGCGDRPVPPTTVSGSGSAAAPGSAGQAGLELSQPGTLRVALEVGYLPFEMRTSKGDLVGFDVDLAGELAKRLGTKVEIVNVEWDLIIPALQNGQADCICSGMSITDERRQKIDFSTPYYQVGQAVLIQASAKDKIKTYKDLDREGAIVVTQNATTGHAAAQKHMPKATIKTYDKQLDAALEVREGRADGLVFDHPFIAIYAMRNATHTAALLEPFTTEDIGVAVRKQSPRLLAAIDQALEAMRKDGTLERLVKQYFVDMTWRAQVPE